MIPNYISDDEGIPVVHAPGGKADIICEGTTYSVLFEVTLLTGVQQHIRESSSITRHLKEYCLTKNNVFSILVTPTIHEDTREHATYIKLKKN
ncbi:AlwI family type II restriction endonuclease [Spiroplasma endosymbiont of Virgichneumon dumeticola]|uniref:AlwI family type II restriction endonuclease n=1 Tax=Spiroplasma endosymbiont of Virgichneumon dumeticola TaxID=3139323 RepID=UPI0035C92666